MNTATLKRLLESDDFLVGISELSNMTNVSPRQLRYWEQKGYITSVGEAGSSRKYKLPMAIKIEMIKHFLDEGFTLHVAVEKAKEHQTSIHQAKLLLKKVFKGLKYIDERFTVIRLSGFSNQEQLLLISDRKNDTVCFEVFDEKTELTQELITQLLQIETTKTEEE
ncbi:MerR family transcriptional regulator [Enterococcus sp. LJL99]